MAQSTLPENLPCFVISLADSSRRGQVVENLAKVGITNPIFFDAVDRKTLTPEQLKLFDDPKHRYPFSKNMRAGSKACLLSHLGVYQKMVDENIPSALVFEDDVEPITADPDLIAERINHLVSLQDRLDVVYLNNGTNRPVVRVDGSAPPKHGLGVIRRANTCNESYFITQRAAAYLASHPKRFAMQIDLFTHHWWYHYPDYHFLYNTTPLFRQADIPSQMAYHIPPDADKRGLTGELLAFLSKQWVQWRKRWLWLFYLQRARARIQQPQK